MKINFNQLRTYSNKKLRNFLINYYTTAYRNGYQRALDNVTEVIKNTKGVGSKTYEKIKNNLIKSYDELIEIKGGE